MEQLWEAGVGSGPGVVDVALVDVVAVEVEVPGVVVVEAEACPSVTVDVVVLVDVVASSSPQAATKAAREREAIRMRPVRKK